MSIARQNQVDVCSPGNLRGAVNIYTHGSGERKKTWGKVLVK